MSWAILLDLLAAGFFISTTLFVSRRRPPAPLWPVLLWVQLLPLLWIAGDIGFRSTGKPAWIDFLCVLIYTGSLGTIAAWWMLALRFARAHGVHFSWTTPAVEAAPIVWAGTTLVCVATNPWHGQFMTPIPGLRSQYHWLWWATAPWGYAIMMATVMVYARVAKRAVVGSSTRGQAQMMTLASVVWPLSNALNTLYPRPLPLDVTVAGVLVTGALFVAGIYRGRLFDLSPIALREILRRQRDGLLIVNADGQLQWENEQARALLGRPALMRELSIETMLARHVRLADENPNAEDEPAAFHALAHGRFEGALFRTIDPKADRWLWLTSHHEPLGGCVSRQLIHVQDVTLLHEAERARENMERHLRRSERLHSLGRLAAGMAHEVNNPVGASLLAAELARSARLDRENREAVEALTDDALDTVIQLNRRAAEIVKGMLRFSRDVDQQRKPCDPAQLIEQAVQLCRHQLERTQAELHCEIESGLPFVLANPVEIEQVLVNLIDNAARSGPPGRAIDVHVRRARGAVARLLLSVEDDGDGMPPEVLEHVFEPFFTARTGADGTGLGLSIVHGIVEDHRGEIEIESAPGQGTKIRIELPIR